MQCIIPLIAIFTFRVLAGEPVVGGGQLNGLEKRQSANFCGTDCKLCFSHSCVISIFLHHPRRESSSRASPIFVRPRQSQNHLELNEVAQLTNPPTVAGNDYYCINTVCCVGSSAWSCIGVNDQCCATGYMCPSGSRCYLDSLGDQLCLSGSTTQSASSGQPAQTSGKSSPTTPAATSSSATQPPSAVSTKSGAEAARRAGYVFAALVPLAISAVLFG